MSSICLIFLRKCWSGQARKLAIIGVSDVVLRQRQCIGFVQIVVNGKVSVNIAICLSVCNTRVSGHGVNERG